MYEVVLHYFSHCEEKAANPQGVGALHRRHIDVHGVDVIGVESNKIAQAGAGDTAEVLGACEQMGNRRYGPTGHTKTSDSNGKGEKAPRVALRRDQAGLLAASCISRKTLERLTRTAYEPSPDTLGAMELAMQLLDPDHPQHIAGWRDVLAPIGLADLLDVTLDAARACFRRQRTWTEAERAKLARFMMSRRASIPQLAESSECL